jgi:hypothetical protein
MELTRVRLTPLDARLTRLLATIPIDVQRDGLSLSALQAALRGRSRGTVIRANSALRRLGFGDGGTGAALLQSAVVQGYVSNRAPPRPFRLRSAI